MVPYNTSFLATQRKATADGGRRVSRCYHNPWRRFFLFSAPYIFCFVLFLLPACRAFTCKPIYRGQRGTITQALVQSLARVQRTNTPSRLSCINTAFSCVCVFRFWLYTLCAGGNQPTKKTKNPPADAETPLLVQCLFFLLPSCLSPIPPSLDLYRKIGVPIASPPIFVSQGVVRSLCDTFFAQYQDFVPERCKWIEPIDSANRLTVCSAIKRPIKSTPKPTNQPTHQPSDQSTNHQSSTNQPIHQATNEPNNKPTNRTINQSTCLICATASEKKPDWLRTVLHSGDRVQLRTTSHAASDANAPYSDPTEKDHKSNGGESECFPQNKQGGNGHMLQPFKTNGHLQKN